MAYDIRPHAHRVNKHRTWPGWLLMAICAIVFMGVWAYLVLLSQGGSDLVSGGIGSAIIVGGLYILWRIMRGHWRDL